MFLNENTGRPVGRLAINGWLLFLNDVIELTERTKTQSAFIAGKRYLVKN